MADGITLLDQTFYPHSFTLDHLAELEEFIFSHERIVTLAEFARGDRDVNAVSVRHDVDHSAQHALRFAQWEAEREIRASYYLLPTEEYWISEGRETARELQRLGHEVGVHNNSYTTAGSISGALSLLQDWVEEMESWGIGVVGCADHGGGQPYNVDMWKAGGCEPEMVGLVYEAYMLHQTGTNYVSDNKGEWRAPRERRPDRPTHILVHPEHWRLP